MPLVQDVAMPTKQGWHIVNFQNGDTAVVRWNGANFVWGSIRAPGSPITGITYVGGTAADMASHGTRWSQALIGLPGQVVQSLTSALDHGDLQLGRPVLVDSTGTPTGGSNPKATAGEAKPVNIIPSPIDPNAGNTHLNVPSISSIFGVFTTMGFWKGIGLVLAGAAILVFAALEFRKLT